MWCQYKIKNAKNGQIISHIWQLCSHCHIYNATLPQNNSSLNDHKCNRSLSMIVNRISHVPSNILQFLRWRCWDLWRKSLCEWQRLWTVQTLNRNASVANNATYFSWQYHIDAIKSLLFAKNVFSCCIKLHVMILLVLLNCIETPLSWRRTENNNSYNAILVNIHLLLGKA